MLGVSTPPPLRVSDSKKGLVGPFSFFPRLAGLDLALGTVPASEHRLSITAFANRVNAFGCVHNADKRLTWFGPNAWRTEGDTWAYEYQLKPMGLLVAPKPRLLR